jgi:hypothetical protein
VVEVEDSLLHLRLGNVSHTHTHTHTPRILGILSRVISGISPLTRPQTRAKRRSSQRRQS